jgi:hypothetical protein
MLPRLTRPCSFLLLRLNQLLLAPPQCLDLLAALSQVLLGARCIGLGARRLLFQPTLLSPCRYSAGVGDHMHPSGLRAVLVLPPHKLR